MEFTKIKELLEEYKHKLINYTDKFINSDYMLSHGNNEFMSRASQIYLKIHDKTKKDKYKKLYFF